MGGLGRGKGWAPSISIVFVFRFSVSLLRGASSTISYDLGVLFPLPHKNASPFFKKVIF